MSYLEKLYQNQYVYDIFLCFKLGEAFSTKRRKKWLKTE